MASLAKLSLISHNVGKRKEATAEWIHLRSNINYEDESMKSTGNIHTYIHYEQSLENMKEDRIWKA